MSIQKTAPPGLNLMDFVLIAFKHKWKVIICTVAGLASAAMFFFTNPPQYESDAKILVRYVVERTPVDTIEGSNTVSKGPNDTVLNSEVEILSSWDVFEEVANEIGPSRICGNASDATPDMAARTIAGGLAVSPAPDSDVIIVSYKSDSPTLAPEILQAVLDAYFIKHLEVHRPKTEFDSVSQQCDIIHAELTRAEEELKKMKADADIISVEDTAASINSELANTRREIDMQKSALAEQTALVDELKKAYGTGEPVVEVPRNPGAPMPAGTTAPKMLTPELTSKYEECVVQINALENREAVLLATYNSDSIPVSTVKSQLATLWTERQQMEQENPGLVATAPMANAPADRPHSLDIVAEQARLVSMQAGMSALESRLDAIQKRARDFAKVAPDIEDLDRTVKLKQADYANAETKLQAATVDNSLDPSKMPNISTVQKPSPAMRVAGKRQKAVMGLAAGGFGIGFGLALLIELILDQSVRRPVELEQRLGIPVWLSIPFYPQLKRKKLPAPSKSDGGNGANGAGEPGAAIIKAEEASIAPWDAAHFARPYAETIRDRLGLYFEANNLTHRPKLLAIAGSGQHSGASTLAAGIAAALSETGEGKVLLVDMNPGRTEAHPFFKGRPACSLDAALENNGALTSAGENLYLATTTANGSSHSSFGLKRLRELIPNIKESDFDYVLFDMPPLSQTSPTAAMAAYMDSFIYLVEAEKANRETVKKDYSQLTARKQDVLVILNKIHSYLPKWIDKGA